MKRVNPARIHSGLNLVGERKQTYRNPNAAKAGGLQSQGLKGDAVISYRNPLIPPTAGQDLKSSGFPAG
ncbi:MAG: hypothetical protein PVG46_03660 [Desulfobacterales bacterium]